MAKLTKEGFQNLIQEIGTCDDDVRRRDLLASLQEDGSAIYDDYDTAEAARATAVADNEILREANMKLFKQIPDHKEPETPKHEPETPKLKYEDLFNEKGELK